MTTEAPEVELTPLQTYWQGRGKGYFQESRLQSAYYREQESFIVKIVRAFKCTSILELGCGFGRVTRRLAEAMPEARILGVDLSEHQIEHARVFCCLEPNVEFACLTIDDIKPLVAKVQIVCAFELFLHLRHAEFRALVERIFQHDVWLIHDYDANPQQPSGVHVFNHDYEAIYAEMGLIVEKKFHGEHHLLAVRRA